MLQDYSAGRALLGLVNKHVSGASQQEFVAAAELLERQVLEGNTSITLETQPKVEVPTVATHAAVQPPNQDILIDATVEVTFDQLNCLVPR